MQREKRRKRMLGHGKGRDQRLARPSVEVWYKEESCGVRRCFVSRYYQDVLLEVWQPLQVIGPFPSREWQPMQEVKESVS